MGKHHRPFQPLRVAVLAGVIASAVAVPLLGAASASAASVPTWDQVAQCESSGNWANHDSGGNGHYGGLQFSPESWAAAGGLQYAKRADYASKDQQIAVAEALLAKQGPGAWECAAAGGLTAGGPAADVNPSNSRSSGGAASSSTSAAVTAPAASPRQAQGTYIVKSGDTLSGIAQAHHVAGGWQKLHGLNTDNVPDANRIFPGQHLRLS